MFEGGVQDGCDFFLLYSDFGEHDALSLSSVHVRAIDDIIVSMSFFKKLFSSNSTQK